MKKIFFCTPKHAWKSIDLSQILLAIAKIAMMLHSETLQATSPLMINLNNKKKNLENAVSPQEPPKICLVAIAQIWFSQKSKQTMNRLDPLEINQELNANKLNAILAMLTSFGWTKIKNWVWVSSKNTQSPKKKNKEITQYHRILINLTGLIHKNNLKAMTIFALSMTNFYIIWTSKILRRK